MFGFIVLILPQAFQGNKQQLIKMRSYIGWHMSLNSTLGQFPIYFFCCMLLLYFYQGTLTVHAFTGTYGINYGRIADNIPPPESVVTLLKAARVKNVKIFDADHSVIQAFKGSGLNLVVGIGNEYLKDMSVNEGRAMDWIKENVQPFLPDTHIRGITIGNEVLGGGDQELEEALFGAIKNVYSSISKLQSEIGSIDLYHGRSDEGIRAHLNSSSSTSLMAASPAVASLALPFKRSKKNVCLFFCEEMRELAELVAMENDAIELRSIDWRTFEDGFPNLFIPNAHGIRGKHVSFLASFSSPGVLFEQLSIIYALPRLFVSSFTVVLPFFPTGSYERMEDEGDVATACTLAKILSSIPISRGGPSSLVIFDIHALQERFYFGDNVLPCFLSGMPLLKNRLQQLPDSDNISIAFPDDGSWKRFHKQLQHFPMIVCTKVREGDQRFVRLKEGDPKGRHVVIVDDFVQSGGTLIECQKVLAAHGAACISAYVTHGIFPNKTWQRFKYDDGACPDKGMRYFWITDSCPLTVKDIKGTRPFEVLSLSGSIADALQI